MYQSNCTRSKLLLLYIYSGYLRIFLTTIACYWMFTDPLKAAFAFSLSHTVLDDLDGIAARWLKQGYLFMKAIITFVIS